MRNFEYTSPPVHVVFAAGAARNRLADMASLIGAQRLLLVTEEPLLDLARKLTEPLGERVVGVFDGVRPHVPVAVAEQARRVAAECDADAVVSVGGGSSTGTAKAIALTTGLPIIAVPTTYAGSEATPVWGLTEDERKTTGRDPRVQPKVIVYDPDLTLSLPPGLTAASGLNALAHSVEALWAPGANPLNDAIALESIRALARGLPAIAADPEDPEARAVALYGAWLAGTAFATAGSSLHHKTCHTLGGAYDLPHAETHAVVLPYVTAFVRPAIGDADARIAAALGAGDGVTAAAALAELAGRLGAPSSLAEVGLREPQLAEAARLVAEHAPDAPRPLDEEQARALLTAAWRGDVPVTEEALA